MIDRANRLKRTAFLLSTATVCSILSTALLPNVALRLLVGVGAVVQAASALSAFRQFDRHESTPGDSSG